MCCVLLVGSAGSEPAAQLCEKAKHHSASVCKVDGHLARQKDDPDNTERYTLHGSLIWMSSKSVCVCVCSYSEHCSFGGCFRATLWATLAKTAAKHKAWDVCRAACRFCLLYDDGRWTKTDSKMIGGAQRGIGK